MNKYKKIDNFLNEIAKIAKENPSLNFDSESIKNLIYHNLTRIGVSNEDLNVDFYKLGYFEGWINQFKDSNNIKCFVDPSWSYFCQFTNGTFNQKDYIKMYVPLDKNHIYNGASMIFEFLEKNNIEHHSKVGKKTRFDDIVIRLKREEDAELLASFIKNNSYIQEGLIDANPFTYSEDGIAYACDGRISYNSTVASIIKMYISNKKANNSLDHVGVLDFYNYLTNYYNITMKNGINEKFKFDFNISSIDESIFENYKQVLTLMINSIDVNYKHSDYIKHFNKNNNQDTQKTDDLLKDVLSIMSEKYGMDAAIFSISTYLKYGSINSITRDNNLRERVYRSNLRSDINTILNDRKINFDEYILGLKSKINNQDEKEEILNFGLQETYNKYENTMQLGISYALNAILRLILEDSYNGFTRNNDARIIVQNKVSKEDAINILKNFIHDNNVTLVDMAKMYVNNKITKETVRRI